MADAVNMKEDGEIDSSGGENDEVYKKVERPQVPPVRIFNGARDSYKSDSSPSSDSEGDSHHKKLLKRMEKPPQHLAASASKSKSGSLWKSMLQEESLTETLKTCDVSSRKRKFGYGPESYDLDAKVGSREEDRADRFIKRRKMEMSGNDSSSSNASTKSAGKRAKKQRYLQRKRNAPKHLPDLTVPLEGSEEEFGFDLAHKLEENNSELILKVVAVIGREASLNLFKVTQKIELNGGMLTMNKIRRRTPGGIFLFLLKTSNKIDEDQKQEIFGAESSHCQNGTANRKVSSDHMDAKGPPNSPTNPDFHEVNGKLTDPDLVSQKILNFSKPEPSDDILELDDDQLDMDTF